VLGHRGIERNKSADQLAKTSSAHPFVGPQLACRISEINAKRAIMVWAGGTNIIKNNVGGGGKSAADKQHI
jgi:hypothetical protein